MVQWISAVNHYYYPYFSYHLAHERMIFPALGIAPDEKVVAAALPKVATALEVLERELADGRRFIIGDQLTLADFYMTPTLSGLVFTPEGAEMLQSRPGINAWQARIGALPSVQTVRAMVAPHIGKPVEHARSWVTSHRPRY
jgi:glutathione S-transferase